MVGGSALCSITWSTPYVRDSPKYGRDPMLSVGVVDNVAKGPGARQWDRAIGDTVHFAIFMILYTTPLNLCIFFTLCPSGGAMLYVYSAFCGQRVGHTSDHPPGECTDGCTDSSMDGTPGDRTGTCRPPDLFVYGPNTSPAIPTTLPPAGLTAPGASLGEQPI